MANEVQVIIKAVDQTTGVLTGIKGGLLGLGAAALGAAAAFAGVAFAAGNELEKAFNTIIIGTGASGEALAGLQDDFRAVFRDVPADAAATSAVIAELNTRLDITGESLQAASKAVLDFSRVNKMDAQVSARITGQLLNALGMEAADTSLLLDKLTLAGQMSGISVEKLGNWIIDAGPAFDNLGFDLDRTIALFSTFEKAGARPEEVISSMGKALTTLAKEGFTDAEAAFNEYMKRIEEAPDILSATLIANELFGARVGGKIAEDIRAGRFEVDEWAEIIGNASGTLDDVAARTLTWSEKLDILKNRGMLALEPLGGYLVDAASALMDEALPAFDAFVVTAGALWAELSEVAQNSEDVQAVMEILTETFNEIAGAVIPFLVEQFELFAAWFEENEDLITAFKDTLIEAFGIAASVVSSTITGILIPLLESMMQSVRDMGVLVMQVVTGDWAGAWETAKGLLSSFIDTVLDLLANFFETVTGWFGSSTEEFLAIWTSNWNQMHEIAAKVGSIIGKAIREFLDDIASTIKGAASDMYQAGQDMLQGLADGIMDKAGEVLSNIIAIANEIKAAFAGIMQNQSPSKVFAGFGEDIMQGLAQGIDKSGKFALQSIRDQAGMLLDVGANMSTGAMAGAGFGMAGTNNITINVSGAGDPEAVAREIMRQLNRQGVRA